MIFEFFIAIVGITFFAAKFGAEKIRESEQQGLNAAYQGDRDAWLSQWTDQNLEQELEKFVSDNRNYNQVCLEIGQTLSELPILREYVGFGAEWYECGMYSYYWRKRGLSQKAAIKQAYAMRIHIIDTMLATRGKAPCSWSYHYAGFYDSGCPASVELALFQWCVKKLRAYGMSDPVVVIKRNDKSLTPGRAYTLRPLSNDRHCSVVSDEEIVMM